MDTTEYENSLNQSLIKAITQYISDKQEIRVGSRTVSIAELDWVTVKPSCEKVNLEDLIAGNTVEIEVDFNCRFFEDQGNGNSRSTTIEGRVEMMKLMYTRANKEFRVLELDSFTANFTAR